MQFLSGERNCIFYCKTIQFGYQINLFLNLSKQGDLKHESNSYYELYNAKCDRQLIFRASAIVSGIRPPFAKQILSFTHLTRKICKQRITNCEAIATSKQEREMCFYSFCSWKWWSWKICSGKENGLCRKKRWVHLGISRGIYREEFFPEGAMHKCWQIIENVLNSENPVNI